MMILRVLTNVGLCVMLLQSCGTEPLTTVGNWRQGVMVTSPVDPAMQTFLWFYEWHMFGAVKTGLHTGAYNNRIDWSAQGQSTNESGTESMVEWDHAKLEARSTPDGADLTLTIRNTSDHDWSALASIIPCLNPGPSPNLPYDFVVKRNEAFVDLDSARTWFIGPNGITLLDSRDIHFSNVLRPQIEEVRGEVKRFPWDPKWPTSPINATEGLLMRESVDGQWTMGIAWESFLSSQGHNPWLCMHMGVNIGPLKQGETRQVRGKMYLIKGAKEDCYALYRKDFSQ